MKKKEKEEKAGKTGKKKAGKDAITTETKGVQNMKG